MKTLLLIIASCLLLYREAVAQTINGPSSAQVGQTFDYTLNSGTIYSNEVWSLIGGTKVSQTRVGTLYTVTVNWTSAGAGKVTFLSNYVPVAYKNVTVTGCSAPPTPSTTLSASSQSCGPKTLSYSGSPPSGVTWYWQTSSTGTSTSYPTTYSAGSTGTYYLRAKANCGSVWSSSYKSIANPTGQKGFLRVTTASNIGAGSSTVILYFIVPIKEQQNSRDIFILRAPKP